MSLPTDHIIQQIILLATGAPSSSPIRNELNDLYQQSGDWRLVAALVDEYMGQLSSQNSLGITGIIQAIANNGFSLKLSIEESQQLVDELIQQGIDSWSKLFTFIITEVDGELGERLDNRATSANIFTDVLQQLNKNVDYNGSQAINAAKEWISGIGASLESVTAANHAVQDLIARFHSGEVINTAIDGYIAGATVFIDINGDGIQNADEPSTITDALGNFRFSGTLPEGQIVSIGGTDITTDQPFLGVLTAPSGSTTITPLTTLINALIKSGQATNTDTAESLLFAAFGIPRVDLSTFDPINVALNTNASNEDKAIAIKLQALTAQIINVMLVTTELINEGNASGGIISQFAIDSLLSSIVSASENNQTLDLSNQQTISSLITTAATSAGITQDIATLAAQSATVLNDINSRIQAATENFNNGDSNIQTTLSDIFKLQTLTQTEIITAINTTEQSGNLNSVISRFTGNNLSNNLDVIQLGPLNASNNSNDGSDLTNPPAPPAPPTPPTPDTQAPYLLSITALDQTYKVIETITISINYNEIVIVNTTNGMPSLTLSNATTADYVSGSGSSALNFNYIVSEGDTDTNDLDVMAIELNGGTIKDTAGNNALTTLGSIDLATNNSVVVDANSPEITSVTVADDTYKVGDSVAVTLTASNNETGLSLSSASFNGQTLTGFTDNSDGTYSATYTVVEGDA
ncbi:MAG: hypothetical protein K9L22_06510, partial [Methylococcaceae bacterium]|nr:hypothetical protein [Methylococcaceae bacterium]